MSQIIPIYIPTYIGDQNYNPNRVLPRLLFYNGLIDCEEYYIESGSLTNSGISKIQNAFPYFDNYNVVTGSFPTINSDSLLFNNENASYGQIPTGSLYTTYWETYVNLLYNPRTRLFNCEAIIPLADYYKMELNDIVEWRGNYYHLRAINEYNLKNGECKIQLLGPIQPPVISNLLPDKDCGFSFTSSFIGITTSTTTTTSTTSTTSTTTTTAAPVLQRFGYSGPGGSSGTAGTFIDFNGITRNIEYYTFGTGYAFVGYSGSVNITVGSYVVTQASSSYPTFNTVTATKRSNPGLTAYTGQDSQGNLLFISDGTGVFTRTYCWVTNTAQETYDPIGNLTLTQSGAC